MMKKTRKSRQNFGRFYAAYTNNDQSPEIFNRSLYPGLSFSNNPFQVKMISPAPLSFGSDESAAFPTVNFTLNFSVNKGYVIDATRLTLSPTNPTVISLRENRDLVIISNGTKRIVKESEYLDDALSPRINGDLMIDNSFGGGPEIPLFFNFVNGFLSNNKSAVNGPELWMEIKHLDLRSFSKDVFVPLTTVNIYSTAQLALKYSLSSWAPFAGDQGEDFNNTTSYVNFYSASAAVFAYGLGRTFLSQKSATGEPLPPGWENTIPISEWAFFHIDPNNLLYNLIVGIPGND